MRGCRRLSPGAAGSACRNRIFLVTVERCAGISRTECRNRANATNFARLEELKNLVSSDKVSYAKSCGQRPALRLNYWGLASLPPADNRDPGW
jgi:hypothetical protein